MSKVKKEIIDRDRERPRESGYPAGSGSCRFMPVPVHAGSGSCRFWFIPVPVTGSGSGSRASWGAVPFVEMDDGMLPLMIPQT